MARFAPGAFLPKVGTFRFFAHCSNQLGRIFTEYSINYIDFGGTFFDDCSVRDVDICDFNVGVIFRNGGVSVLENQSNK